MCVIQGASARESRGGGKGRHAHEQMRWHPFSERLVNLALLH